MSSQLSLLLVVERCTTHRRVSSREFFDLEITASGPVRRGHALWRGLGFVLDLEVLFDSLQTATWSDKQQ